MVDTPIQNKQSVTGELLECNGELYYKISNSHAMRTFFMSIVSDSNHWMFISSNGGITAGRKNAEYSLFPYYTDDKIIESAETTGSKTIIRLSYNGQTTVWEPFSIRNAGLFRTSQNIYKSIYGNSIRFEEINHDLGLSFQYQWSSSNKYGFVRKSIITNNTEDHKELSVVDGIQNLLPYGVGSDLQNKSSNLVDAYKRNELHATSGLGIYALSAIIVDKAEPSEALKANIAYALGLDRPLHLVSSQQLDRFREGQSLQQETDVKAEKGAYFIQTELNLHPQEASSWHIIANVNQSQSDVVSLCNDILHAPNLIDKITLDIQKGTERLIGLCASSDGLQHSADALRDSRHYSNALFNIMRGGIFDDDYNIEVDDLLAYMEKANKAAYQELQVLFENATGKLSLQELSKKVSTSNNRDLKRLALEYLPLKFSRRHGDPSRPWNIFNINTHSEIDGSKILDYEGNWRDIFQNWEALAYAFPEYIEPMIQKFLNASTFDGYNPYRVTKDGFDWETIEPDDPWSYIGYWGDHQIIYLLKFLEFIEKHQPGRLHQMFDNIQYVYANVPYKIKPYQDLLKNPKDTIDFDTELDEAIHKERQLIGSDGALLKNQQQHIHYVSFAEKLLATVLAKMSNYIPEAGIWMNTQRPEWNDANNALVGNGVSMVTLYYLRRFLKFFDQILDNAPASTYAISTELKDLFKHVLKALKKDASFVDGFDDKKRKSLLDALGSSASDYRNLIYKNGFSGEFDKLSSNELKQFIQTALEHLEHSIRANKREDKMFHAYNLMTVQSNDSVSVSYLDMMLEGQVAVLSSGYLTSEEVLEVLDAMKASPLFRPDQYSYLLYPNKELPRFLERNNVPEEQVRQSALLTELIEKGNRSIVEKDIEGNYHFNGLFKNANDLSKALDTLPSASYIYNNQEEHERILALYESVFNHKAFTGRSGTFYGYEGLGSIYWHMVSKLLLAVQECCLAAIEKGASDEIVGRLLEHYYEINEGIGVHKSPKLYGAFPIDPYSHTPGNKGAQQPGMTGQVKEDILSRFGELGVFVNKGCLHFNPCLLRKGEFVNQASSFHFIDINNQRQRLDLPPHSLAFTYCQVPMVYQMNKEESVQVVYHNGIKLSFQALALNDQISKELFERRGFIKHVTINCNPTRLK